PARRRWPDSIQHDAGHACTARTRGARPPAPGHRGRDPAAALLAAAPCDGPNDGSSFMALRNRGVVPLLALLTAAAAAVPRQAAAQTSPPATAEIVGTVRDRATGAPLPAARARLLETHREELTHADGAFHFPQLAPGTYTLEIEHPEIG